MFHAQIVASNDLDPTPDNSRTTTAEPVNPSMDLESPIIPTIATHIDPQAITTAETQDLEMNILDILRTSPPSPPGKKPITYIRSKDGLSYNRLIPTDSSSPAKVRHKSSRHHNSLGPNSNTTPVQITTPIRKTPSTAATATTTTPTWTNLPTKSLAPLFPPTTTTKKHGINFSPATRPTSSTSTPAVRRHHRSFPILASGHTGFVIYLDKGRSAGLLFKV